MGNYNFSAELSCRERHVPYSQMETEEQKKRMLGLGANTRIIFHVLYIHPFEGISALTFKNAQAESG